MSNKPKFATRQDQAERLAQRLIYTWIDDGRTASNDLPLDQFPTATLATIAEAVAGASEQGVRGMADVLTEAFSDAPDHIRAAVIDCCEDVHPTPGHCQPLVERLRAFHVEKRRRELGDRLRREIEAADDIEATIAEIAELEAQSGASADAGKPTLRERAYAMRFDPATEPPPDEVCMVIGDIPIAARGNLTAIQGKSKVGKSALMAAILGAGQRGNFSAIGDTLCVEWTGAADGAIIHLDTEQSLGAWHGLVCRSVTRSGLRHVSPRLVSLPLVMFTRAERLSILRDTMEHEHERGGVDLVIIDGVADLCVSPNDEGEALQVISAVHALSQKYRCPIFCGLHENPGSEIGKTRGHLGSELNRKAFANLRIDKDAETSISTIYGTDMRKRDIPREQGFCFAWDDAAGMHAFQGRAAGLKAAENEARATAKSREEWLPIFEKGEEIGTNLTCPSLTPEEAAKIERDIDGTKKLTKTETMKKRMQRAEVLGVLRRTGNGAWTLSQSGQTEQNRDK